MKKRPLLKIIFGGRKKVSKRNRVEVRERDRCRKPKKSKVDCRLERAR